MMIKRPKLRPWMLKKEIIILYYALRDKRTPVVSKLPAVLSIIYLLSPVDLIPDFIPFFGYVDDIIIVPLLLNLAIRLLPSDVREESMLKAVHNKRKFQIVFILFILLLLAFLAGTFVIIRHLFFSH